MKPFRIVLSTIGVLIVGVIVFTVSGRYNVSARVPHLAPTALLLEAARDRSIAHYSSKIELPAQADPKAAMVGAVHFDATCRKCHGAPGKSQEEFAEGLYPKPPSLTESAGELDRKEIFWVIDNGLKMTGMPAFGDNHEREDIIGIWRMTHRIKSARELLTLHKNSATRFLRVRYPKGKHHETKYNPKY
jgi:mono/diheme cytochrome c family protein